jgi:peptidylprolyl isomerase
MQKQFIIALGILVIVLGVVLIVGKPAQAPTETIDQVPVAQESTPMEPTDTNSTASAESAIKHQATLTTNLGTIVIQLDMDNTPNTAGNFTKLASEGFYNGTKFHRVIPGFMIQGGDPLSKDDTMSSRWGTGGPGYKFADEIKSTNKNVRGSISMANSGPNTNGSQFFINVADNDFLDPKHTVFGNVISGMDVVDAIAGVKTGMADRPVVAVVVTKIEIK